jgi:geranyl-CoA carboxylase alpha subunit
MTKAPGRSYGTILIANRGEIAVRIARTARAMGYRTVAVFSDVDADMPHVTAADRAVAIGGAVASESYLNMAKLLDAARRTGADAVHPGYGFLSENAAFAEACADAGLVFIGPPPAAIRAMADKARAKQLMLAAGVPCVPGYDGEDQSPARLAREADRIGYPVMIKAVAGGGGKGMRLVATPDDFAEALASARSEAAKAFGRGDVLLEKAIVAPRHVEVQVFADMHGNVAHLATAIAPSSADTRR